MHASATDLIIQLLPMMLLTFPLVFGVFYLAPKMKVNPWIWAILFLIPVVNFYAAYVFLLRVAGAVLDRLNVLSAEPTATKDSTNR